MMKEDPLLVFQPVAKDFPKDQFTLALQQVLKGCYEELLPIQNLAADDKETWEKEAEIIDKTTSFCRYMHTPNLKSVLKTISFLDSGLKEL